MNTLVLTKVLKVVLVAILMLYAPIELSRCALVSTTPVTFHTPVLAAAFELSFFWLAYMAGIYLIYRWMVKQ